MPLLLGVALVVAACSDDEDADAPDDGSRPSIETTEPIIVEVTPPLELSASADPEFLADVVADDVVTADEVEEAYGHYIDCLADGGAAGIYAFDLALRVAVLRLVAARSPVGRQRSGRTQCHVLAGLPGSPSSS